MDTAFSDTDQKGEPTPAVTDNTTKTTATSSNAVTGADDSGKNTGSDDFERIEDDLGDDVGDADDDLFGGELDELEAEIARELED